MRWQYNLLMFIVCFNLAIGLVLALNLPGTAYVNPTNPTKNTTDYESQFNATEIAKGWKPSFSVGILVIDEVFSMFNFLWRNLVFLIDGFPQMLDWISYTFSVDASGQTALGFIKWAWRAVFSITMTFFVIEFISGRTPSD